MPQKKKNKKLFNTLNNLASKAKQVYNLEEKDRKKYKFCCGFNVMDLGEKILHQ